MGLWDFEPRGENLLLIMVVDGKADERKNTGRYIIESRINNLINELNVDKTG